MEVHSVSAAVENNYSSIDGFNNDALHPGNYANHGSDAVGQQENSEHAGETSGSGDMDGGTSYLPSDPEASLPPQDFKLPPSPISINDENHCRGNWGTKFEFLAVILCQLTPISVISMFQYRMYSGGGVLFLGPYVLCHVVLGFPVILLAISLGQFSSTGFLTSWNFMPVLKGVSVLVFLQTAAGMLYTNILLQGAYSYVFETLVNYPVLPWMTCDNPWNNEVTCRDGYYGDDDNSGSSASSWDWYNGHGRRGDTSSDVQSHFLQYEVFTDPGREYFLYMYGGGRITGAAAAGAVAALVVVFVTTMMGVKVVGKFCICALLASLGLTIILMIRSSTLPGATTGRLFLLTEGYLSWDSAFYHVCFTLFYSFWPCLGLASHNRFHNNCFLDTVLLVVPIISAPILIAISIFSFLGFFAQEVRMSINDAADSGPSLMFASMPYWLGYLPEHTIWNMFWFLLLSLNLLTTQIGSCLAMVSSILDLFGWVHGWRKLLPVTLVICLTLFCLTLAGIYGGIDMCAYILYLGFAPTAPIPIILLCLGLVWYYALRPKIDLLRYANDIGSMVRFFYVVFKVNFTFWWALVVPGVFLFAVIDLFSDLHLTSLFPFARSAWITSCVAAGVLGFGIIAGAIHEAWRQANEGTNFIKGFYRATLPLPQWGPALEQHREETGYPPHDPTTTPVTPQLYPLSHLSGMGGEGVINPGLALGYELDERAPQMEQGNTLPGTPSPVGPTHTPL